MTLAKFPDISRFPESVNPVHDRGWHSVNKLGSFSTKNAFSCIPRFSTTEDSFHSFPNPMKIFLRDDSGSKIKKKVKSKKLSTTQKLNALEYTNLDTQQDSPVAAEASDIPAVAVQLDMPVESQSEPVVVVSVHNLQLSLTH